MDTEKLARALQAGDRRALAKAITLVESGRSEDRLLARELLVRLPRRESVLRLGITGAPGVGKSTFIDALGHYLIEQGRRPGVVAYDPSGRAGGSVLGDKTRMERLAHAEAAFVRPSANRRESGGIGAAAFDVVRLCGAAGYDPVIVETVGVGQSELRIAELCDLLVVLLLPNAGDELQGIKKGLLEHADLVLVNKADGELRPAAERTLAQYQHALSLLAGGREDSKVRFHTVSALAGTGIPEVWRDVEVAFADILSSGRLVVRRADRLKSWFREGVEREIVRRVLARPEVAALRAELEDQLARQDVGLDEALERLVEVAVPRQP